MELYYKTLKLSTIVPFSSIKEAIELNFPISNLRKHINTPFQDR
ncbi:MAG: hypothetical protein V8R81_03225 [Clostridia bacterium]